MQAASKKRNASAAGQIWSSEYWANKGSVKLNLWRKRIGAPRRNGEPLPVLFLVHGSSNSTRSSYDLTVPGNILPAAGVTWVSVKPTHRRRGVLRDMMQRQLNDVHERSEPLAILWASESIIYGRFGYGLAAQNMEFSIDRLRTGLAEEKLVSGRMRLVTRDEAIESWPSVYHQVRHATPGFYSRSERWWQHQTLRGPDMERRAGARFYAQYEEDGEVLGYARYRIRPGALRVVIP